jgi:signal recognition particle subunit SRP72
MRSYESLVHDFRDKTSIEYQRIVGELVMVAAKVEPSLALRFASELPIVDGINQVNLDTLEAVPSFHAPKSTGVQKMDVVNKKKRKRKVRYPKNFDPANPGPLPDPERWLPFMERKSNKNKKKKKATSRGGGQGATQEATKAAEKTLDASQMSVEAKKATAAASAASVASAKSTKGGRSGRRR